MVVASPVIAIIGALVVSVLIDPFFTQFHSGSLVNVLTNNAMWSIGRILNGFLSILLTIGSMLYLNRLVSEEALLGKLSNLPLVSFAIGVFLIPVAYQNVTFWSSVLLFIVFLGQCLNCINEKKLAYSVFNAAFMVGLLCLFSSGYIVHIITLFAALIVGGHLTVKRLFLAIFGVVTPIYLFATIFYIFWPEKLWISLGELYISVVSVTWSAPSISVIIVVVMNIVFVLLQTRSITMREKRLLRFQIIVTVVSISTILLAPTALFIGLVLVPLVILNARAMSSSKSKWVTRILFYSLVVAASINITFTIYAVRWIFNFEA